MKSEKAGQYKKKFSRIYIEITNRCNLSCSFCVGNTRPLRDMTVAEFAAVLPQVKAYTDYIYLHVLGEPLLHPDLGAFLALAQSAKLQVNITTNGTLLAQKQALLLAAPALRKVSVSLHSLESQGDAKGYLEQVVAFAKVATQAEIVCELRLWNLQAMDTDNEPIFAKLCDLLAIDAKTQGTARGKIGECGSIRLAPNLYLGTAARFAWPSLLAAPTEGPVFCYGLRGQAAILCDGTVVPCCLDSKGDISLGNAFQTTLAACLSSDRAKGVYDGFTARVPKEALCRRCGYATRF